MAAAGTRSPIHRTASGRARRAALGPSALAALAALAATVIQPAGAVARMAWPLLWLSEAGRESGWRLRTSCNSARLAFQSRSALRLRIAAARAASSADSCSGLYKEAAL